MTWLKRFLHGVSPLAIVLVPLASPAQTPDHVWSKRFGAAGADATNKVATDALNNVLLTGQFAGSVDFGGGPLVSAGNTDVFLVKLDANGDHQWSRRFGGASADDGFDVAADAFGNVYVTGAFQGTANFGGGSLTSAGGRDIFLAKFDFAGTHLWSKRFGGASDDFGYSLAVDGTYVIVAGRFRGVISFGGPLIDTHNGFNDIFLAKYDANGVHQWSSGFEGTDTLNGTAVAVDAQGHIFLTGSFAGTTSFGGGPLTSNETDIFLAKFDSGGNHWWSVRYGSGPRDAAYDIVVDVAGNILITGFFGFTTNGGTIDFGGGPLVGAGSADIFVAKFENEGAHVWSQRFGCTDFDTANAIAVDALGNCIITGRVRLGADFGGGFLNVVGLNDVFLAKYSANGTPQWSRLVGDTGSDIGLGLATDASGHTLCAGEFTNTVEFGGPSISSAGGDDAFVAKLADPQPVPVLITDFRAAARAGSIHVAWAVWSNEALESFTLFRQDDVAPGPVAIANGRVDVKGQYTDSNVLPDTRYHYQLVVSSSDGEYRSPIATATTPALLTSLRQNHPNPFTPSTTIEYTLGAPANAVLAIYDAAGSLVVRLDQGFQDAGPYRTIWDGRDAHGRAVGSGVYFYRLEGMQAGGGKKMVLVR